MKAARSRSRFGARGVRARVYRQKALRIGKAHAFHEAPAEPVLAAFEPAHSVRRKANLGEGSEEATGVSEVPGLRFRTAEENAAA
jgi:hypothetical protein